MADHQRSLSRFVLYGSIAIVVMAMAALWNFVSGILYVVDMFTVPDTYYCLNFSRNMSLPLEITARGNEEVTKLDPSPWLWKKNVAMINVMVHLWGFIQLVELFRWQKSLLQTMGVRYIRLPSTFAYVALYLIIIWPVLKVLSGKSEEYTRCELDSSRFANEQQRARQRHFVFMAEFILHLISSLM